MCIKNEKIISCFFSLMVKCIAAFITLLKPFMGRSGGTGDGGALCVEMVFYMDISWKSRCSIEINF